MNIQRAILLVLSASPRPLTATIIQGKLGQFIEGDWTADDVTRELGHLQRKGEATGAYNADTGTQWKETTAGLIRIS